MNSGSEGSGSCPQLGVFSRRLLELDSLASLLGTKRFVFRPSPRQASTLDAVIGWGHKPTARAARQYAKEYGLPYWAIEDGFLRSIDLGSKCPPLSLVVDKLGIYYDAAGPSALEELLASSGEHDALCDHGLLQRARECRERIIQARLSKYNHAPDEVPPELSNATHPVVLVVDQTRGDASVELGQGSPERFSDMVAAACSENPGATIVVKTHPDTAAGTKRGYLDRRVLPHHALLLSDPINPHPVLACVDRVYVCTSQLGFEALMLNKRVTCFGVPFYSGWGLTDDRIVCDRRNRNRSLEELVAAALILYPRYVHPFSGEPTEIETLIEHLALQRHWFAANSGRIFCTGVSLWKRPFVRRYLYAPNNEIRFFSSVTALKAALDARQARLLTWGNRHDAELRTLAESKCLTLLRMEDGFIRSVGLGSDLTVPGSLVVDSQGIYYDPRQPSELETLLQTRQFSKVELEQAERLRQRIVASGISKYNTDADRPFRPRARDSQTVVLVPGQVEDDASVVCGSPEVRSNTALLRAVRDRLPDAYIIYKPHPDVVSGNRRGRLDAPSYSLFDEMVTDVPISRCLEAAHELHTMTSLVGFEALMRNIRVVTHGQPFYSGWGLTEDLCVLARRKRRLSLNELVAGVLLVYPRYYHFRSLAFCTAEQLVAELERQRQTGQAQLRLPWLLRRGRHLLLLAREIVHARL
jgi:capsular polysaccharide export protein